MFNVRIKRFYDTEQIQIFSDSLNSKGVEREDNRKFVVSTGEICPHNRTIMWDNPFDDSDYTFVQNMGNEEINLQRSLRRSKNEIYDIARSNKWEWFFTLTFNPDKVDSYDYSECTRKLSVWLMNMRKKCPNMMYLVVPEMHKSGRWHFHGLFAGVDNLVFVNSGKCDKKGKVIYNVDSYRLGFSTATKIKSLDKVSNYIGKYITKELCTITKGKKRYWSSRNVQKPIITDTLEMMSFEKLVEKYSIDSSCVKVINGSYMDVAYIDKSIRQTPIFPKDVDKNNPKWYNITIFH